MKLPAPSLHHGILPLTFPGPAALTILLRAAPQLLIRARELWSALSRRGTSTLPHPVAVTPTVQHPDHWRPHPSTTLRRVHGPHLPILSLSFALSLLSPRNAICICFQFYFHTLTSGFRNAVEDFSRPPKKMMSYYTPRRLRHCTVRTTRY